MPEKAAQKLTFLFASDFSIYELLHPDFRVFYRTRARECYTFVEEGRIRSTTLTLMKRTGVRVNASHTFRGRQKGFAVWFKTTD